MKIGMKCSVDSNTEIGKESIQVTVDGTDFTLVPSEDGLLHELTVVVGIDHEKGFISSISPAREITVTYDWETSNKLIDMIQYIDASLSFQFGVKRIYWEERETFFIPESEEEQRNLDVTSYSLHKQPYPQRKEKLTANAFKEIIEQKSKYEPLKMIKFFHREGVNEFNSFRYIQAFYNFYFVLEDIYAQGKTNNNEVVKKFKSNESLKVAIQIMLYESIKGEHLISLQDFLKEENKPFSVDGIIELIVMVRGNLHHYYGKSTKRKGTPINQRDFKSMAYLLMGLSAHSIIYTKNGLFVAQLIKGDVYRVGD